MFKRKLNLKDLNELNKCTLMDHLGIEYIDFGNDFIKARMPVDQRTQTPFGILHGGASVALAETLGSLGAHLCIDDKNQRVVGLEINANHVKSALPGFVFGTARPIHIGKRTQVWEIKIENEQDELVCISRITVAIIPINNQ